MEATISELEHCKFAVKCEANAIEIADKKTEVLKAFENAPVKGFRGKASMDAVRMQYSRQIHDALQRAMAEFCMHEAIFQHALKPHGAPFFKSLLLEGGKFFCEFDLYTKPNFDLPKWQEMEIPKPHESFTATEITEQMLQEIRMRLGDAVPYGDHDFVQEGDNVIVDYEGSLDGNKVDSLCAKDEMMTIGKSPLQGFDQNLLGMIMGETREFDFTAPEGGLPSLSGKTIHFKVSVSTGSKTTPAPLNDELAIKMGKKDFKELQEFVGQASFARVENHNRAKLNEAISNRLVVETTIKVPGFMSLSEAQYLAQQAKLDWNSLADADKERFVQMGENNVKLSLILDKIREDHPEAQLTDQEVFDYIKQSLLQNAQPGADLDKQIQEMNKTGYLQILMNQIKNQQALSFITKTIKIIE